MPVRVEFGCGDIISRFERSNEAAVDILCQRVLADSNFYCPMAEGSLQASALTASHGNSGTVKWDVPYAAYLYYGALMLAPNGSAWAKLGEIKHLAVPEVKLDFDKSSNPNAQAHWFEKAKDVHLDEWVEGYRNMLLR